MRGLLPIGARLAEGDPQALEPEPTAPEARAVQGAVPARRREFAAGRACARRALAQLHVQDFPVLAGPRREPLWPPGVVGSITHTRGYCAAAVARASDLRVLGIDAELVGAVGDDLEELVCSAQERRRGRAGGAGPAWRTVVFSAKESVFKALYPSCGVELAFCDIEIVLDVRTGTFASLPVSDRAGQLQLDVEDLQGRFACGQRLVATAAWLPR